MSRHIAVSRCGQTSIMISICENACARNNGTTCWSASIACPEPSQMQSPRMAAVYPKRVPLSGPSVIDKTMPFCQHLVNGIVDAVRSFCAQCLVRRDVVGGFGSGGTRSAHYH